MRLILAAAILLAGLKTAASAPDYDDADTASNATPVAAAGKPEQAVGTADRTTASGVPAAQLSDSAHGQGEEAADPSPSSSAAGTAGADVNANANVGFEEIIGSLGVLCNALFASARDNDLPVPFFANLIWQESRFRYDAVSPVGAEGIAQFMPRVAAEVGLADPFDPRQAIPASARLLHELREQFSNLGFVAAAYNAGARRVMEWLEHRGGLPRETRIYVVRVTGRSIEEWQKAPPDDFSLTFVRPLPCRRLPAFADLEQAQAQQAAGTTGAGVQQAKAQKAKAPEAQAQQAASTKGARVQQAQAQQALPSERQVAQRREELVLRAHRLFGVRRHALRARLEVVHVIIHIRGDRRREVPGHHPHEKRRVA